MRFLTNLICAFLIYISTLTIAHTKDFRDWFVFCESTLQCTMQTQNEKAGIWGIGFQRSPKANAEPAFFLSTSDQIKPNSTIRLIFDGSDTPSLELKAVEGDKQNGVWHFPGQNSDLSIAQSIIAAKSMKLSVETTGGKKTVDISVSGATAAALYLDEAQRRVGNKDAMHAVGDGTPQDAVSSASKLTSSNQLPAAIKTQWQANGGECSDDYGAGDLIERFGGDRIEGREGAALFILPCGGPGAYNLIYAAYAYDGEQKKATRMYFPTMADSGPTLMDTAINANWDEPEKTLTAFYKGRGLGDCGVASKWKWEGYYYAQFVLIEERAKSDCDGKNSEWPLVWPLQ